MQYAPAKDKPQSKWVLWEPNYRQNIPERLLALTGERRLGLRVPSMLHVPVQMAHQHFQNEPDYKSPKKGTLY